METKRIAIFLNRRRDKELAVTKTVVECIKKYGMEPVASFPLAYEIGVTGFDEKEIPGNVSAALSLGGDGTLLSTARLLFKHDIPVIGVNLGTVGFLAEIEVHDIENAIKSLSTGDYKLTERMVLTAVVERSGSIVFSGMALNDVVVSREGLSRIVRLKVYVDNQYIDSFPGDGVIVSTPTGSTAYTLSAGGPIVQPEMQMMIITPICPHILYSRSFITSPEKEVVVRINDDYPDPAIITLDGQEGFEIIAGDQIYVKRADKEIKFVSISHLNFYDVLRAKIHGWNTDSR
ncbi:MAG: NAD(+)/NADH kinase [Clostridiaceae bacterium]|jgi:NAD+ kinase|nr:NAD(+)/NADH kinase [Clostridiaceae bacterium]